MKNIVFIAAICIAVVSANAAQTTWAIFGVYNEDANVKVDKSYKAYIFTTALAGYDSWSTVKSSSELMTAAVKGYNMPFVDAGKYTDITTKPQHTALGIGLQAGESYSFYALVVNSDYSKYYLSQLDADKLVSAGESDNLSIAWGNQTSRSQAAGAWQAVPEPFSGTLALLGMAGIALRRKLKKAKKA